MVFLYPGAIHIHSTYSDGTGTVEEIAKAAKKAGLSWIIVTDHNNLSAKEGIYDGVCVIVAEEISPLDENHYIALDIKTPISPDLPAADFIQEVKKQGGFGFIAHPDGKVSRKNSYRCLRWSDWSIKDFGGLEIWNFMSNWADCYHERNMFKTAYSYLFRNKVLTGPTKNVLAWWDNLNIESESIIPAIGGLDVHAFDIKKLFVNVKIFPYKNNFKSITNFIYLDNPMPKSFEEQRKFILDAVKAGRNLIMNRVWADGNTPFFYITTKNNKAYSGNSIELSDDSKLIAELPHKGNIKIIRNGKIILDKESKVIELNIVEKGKYRLEVYYKKSPWIFSNPIIVK